MENNELFKKLLANLKLIQKIRIDDGYAMNQITNIGKNSLALISMLQTDDEEDLVLINDVIVRLQRMDGIERAYYNSPEYAKWVRREQGFGNMKIFMDGINCVEGALEIFLQYVGLLKTK